MKGKFRVTAMYRLAFLIVGFSLIALAHQPRAEPRVMPAAGDMPGMRMELCAMGNGRACDLANLAKACRRGELPRCVIWHEEVDSLVRGDPILAMFASR